MNAFYHFSLKTAENTEAIAAALSSFVQAPAVIFLEGQLGAGKTTFMRGFLRGLGFLGRVKSPTFTLVETYECAGTHIVHADLYRLKNTDELEAIGFRDYFSKNSICVIEWASLARDWLPKPQLLCTLKIADEGEGRILKIQASSVILDRLQDCYQ